jgi:ATP-dependent metalloprotease
VTLSSPLPSSIHTNHYQDIQQATNIAYALITQYGYSSKLGNVDLHSDYNSLSPATKAAIESEVRRLVEESRQRATKLLTEKRKELEILTRALLEYETLTKEEMEKVLRGEKLDGKLKAIKNTPIKLPEVLMPVPPPTQTPTANTRVDVEEEQDDGNR